MELQTIIVRDRIDELTRIGAEVRAAGAAAGDGRLAGLRRSLGRRLMIVGVALIDGAGPSGERRTTRSPAAPTA